MVEDMIKFGSVWKHQETQGLMFMVGRFDDNVLFYHLSDARDKRQKVTSSVVKCLMPVEQFVREFYLQFDFLSTSYGRNGSYPRMLFLIDRQMEEWDIWTQILAAKKL